MTPVLYILMRTDLPSMNAGKAMAQASHASNAFIHQSALFKASDPVMVKQWYNETKQGFGTVLVLAANGGQINSIIEKAKETEGVIAGKVIDPTYPYQVTGEIANLINKDTPIYKGDGMFTLYREEVTCAYLFGDKDGAAGGLVAELKLHP
jgi:peptidyl-tRNA hydrolase